MTFECLMRVFFLSLNNTPLAVVGLLYTPQWYKQLKTCNKYRVQQLLQWIKYKALGVWNKML